MKYKGIIFLTSVMLVLISLSPDAFAITAKEIIEKADKSIRGNTLRAIYEITIKSRRFTRTMVMESFEDKQNKKSFGIIKAPAKDAGNRFLLIDKNMWHYVPDIQQTVKVSPSMMLDSWMGSDFTNDDIVKESSIVEDYTHKLIGEDVVDGRKCYKVEMKPKANAAVVWGKIIYYAREPDCLPVREEFYNEHDVLKKIMICSEFKKMHDRIIPTVYNMRTIRKKKKGQYTLMKIKKIRFNIPINKRVFTKQNLKGK